MNVYIGVDPGMHTLRFTFVMHDLRRQRTQAQEYCLETLLSYRYGDWHYPELQIPDGCPEDESPVVDMLRCQVNSGTQKFTVAEPASMIGSDEPLVLGGHTNATLPGNLVKRLFRRLLRRFASKLRSAGYVVHDVDAVLSRNPDISDSDWNRLLQAWTESLEDFGDRVGAKGLRTAWIPSGIAAVISATRGLNIADLGSRWHVVDFGRTALRILTVDIQQREEILFRLHQVDSYEDFGGAALDELFCSQFPDSDLTLPDAQWERRAFWRQFETWHRHARQNPSRMYQHFTFFRFSTDEASHQTALRRVEIETTEIERIRARIEEDIRRRIATECPDICRDSVVLTGNAIDDSRRLVGESYEADQGFWNWPQNDSMCHARGAAYVARASSDLLMYDHWLGHCGSVDFFDEGSPPPHTKDSRSGTSRIVRIGHYSGGSGDGYVDTAPRVVRINQEPDPVAPERADHNESSAEETHVVFANTPSEANPPDESSETENTAPDLSRILDHVSRGRIGTVSGMVTCGLQSARECTEDRFALEVNTDLLNDAGNQAAQEAHVEPYRSCLGPVARLLNRLDSVSDSGKNDIANARRELVALLNLQGMVCVPVARLDSFQPNCHRAIDTVQTDSADQHMKIAKVRSHGWRFADDSRLFRAANVIVYKCEEQNTTAD